MEHEPSFNSPLQGTNLEANIFREAYREHSTLYVAKLWHRVVVLDSMGVPVRMLSAEDIAEGLLYGHSLTGTVPVIQLCHQTDPNV